MEHAAEHHRSPRIGWLRAAVLGANDGIVSIASLVIGVAAANSSRSAVMTAGLAGLIAGAASMAVGEYISVSSQRDTEIADLEMEAAAIESNPEAELRELAAIYIRRGLQPALAREVAQQLQAHDAVGAHARDELGITEIAAARPFQASWTSAVSFTTAAIAPLIAVGLSPRNARVPATFVVALLALALLGVLGARAGGAPRTRAAARVVLGGGIAMALTALIGHLVA
ncbi:MAG TPA: VIT family protein [Acidimicrobiia bacterium]|nr:VIT family protein [Acidimicrobiia bacterium]